VPNTSKKYTDALDGRIAELRLFHSYGMVRELGVAERDKVVVQVLKRDRRGRLRSRTKSRRAQLDSMLVTDLCVCLLCGRVSQIEIVLHAQRRREVGREHELGECHGESNAMDKHDDSLCRNAVKGRP
jgi:hypothetical protein